VGEEQQLKAKSIIGYSVIVVLVVLVGIVISVGVKNRQEDLITPSVRKSLACIIRERHATEGFGRQRIAEEEDGSVKLMRGTWLQALQAHTIEVATILGRGFALCSFGSGENGNSSGERS
jgi:hypothetical protein